MFIFKGDKADALKLSAVKRIVLDPRDEAVAEFVDLFRKREARLLDFSIEAIMLDDTLPINIKEFFKNNFKDYVVKVGSEECLFVSMNLTTNKYHQIEDRFIETAIFSKYIYEDEVLSKQVLKNVNDSKIIILKDNSDIEIAKKYLLQVGFFLEDFSLKQNEILLLK